MVVLFSDAPSSYPLVGRREIHEECIVEVQH